MNNKEELLAGLRNEIRLTRKMLECVPSEKFGWKPHERSMALGRLASHVAETLIWVSRVISLDEYDFNNHVFRLRTYDNTPKMLEIYELVQSDALSLLEETNEEMLNAPFLIRKGDKVHVNLPRKTMIRNLALDHLIHHRGQLSVYLRLLDVPVPGMYGPSADERSTMKDK